MGTQEDIQQRINGRLTIDANLLEGGFSQDIIGSVAYELANIYDTELENITNRVFVSTATGDDLDNVGADYGVDRRQASQAIVYLEIDGDEGAVVNTTTKATYNNLVFTVQEYKVIGASGTVTVKALCDTYGSVGNVAANTITEFVGNPAGLTSVTNPAAAYDGFDKETDADYRARIKLYLAEDAVNCNEAQYKQWALEVAGVKSAVVKPAGSTGVSAGQVGVFIASTTGTVSAELRQAVKDYIDERQFINATVIVNALTNVSINTTATVVLEAGYTVNAVKDEYEQALTRYLDGLEGSVSYFRASDLLFDCSGVSDVTDFKLNNAEQSIALADTEIAVVGSINIGT